MKIKNLLPIVLITLITTLSLAQNKPSNYLDKSWKHVATNMPSEWYGSNEAKLVAENVLLSQKEIGGWEKNKSFHRTFSKSEREHYKNDKSKIGATFDNGATIKELKFLAKVYSKIKDDKYKQAFNRGMNYIFISQYKNGGWPQFFPVRKGSVAYSGHITYNDDAMVNTMKFLKEIIDNDKTYYSLQLTDTIKLKAQKAFDMGIQCFLKTQIIVKNKPTVWCAQHDSKTLLPAKARSYELASFSGAESVGIVLMLMDIKKPSQEIIDAVYGAVTWFENHKIEGLRISREIQKDGKKNRIVVKDKNAPTLWGRFNDLETGKIFFCDRDGVKKSTLAEIGYNRRNGYSWYTNKPEKVLKRFATWKKRISKKYLQETSNSYLKRRWKYVAARMPITWYGSEEAKQVAENVLITQKDIGGWAKNKPYHHDLTQVEKGKYLKNKKEKGGTFDNGATITELRFLAKIYSQIKDDKYKQAFEKGLNYIFIAQYKNGGWPQYFPIKNPEDEIRLDNTAPYSMHITFNDNAMVNTMLFLKEIYLNADAFVALQLSDSLKEKAKKVFNKGIKCILKTQIIVDNKPTVWCAQHDAKTLAPANARSYELASFSGSESVGIVRLLMTIEKPSKKIITSVNGAVNWFKNHRIEGLRITREIQKDGKKNRIVIKDKNAPTLWGRFNDLKTGKIFFCDRDGIKKKSLAEIGYNRRNGYSWYTGDPQIILDDYPIWKSKL